MNKINLGPGGNKEWQKVSYLITFFRNSSLYKEEFWKSVIRHLRLFLTLHFHQEAVVNILHSISFFSPPVCPNFCECPLI